MHGNALTSFFEACQDLWVSERNTNQDYVLHSQIQTAGIRSAEVSGKILLLDHVPPSPSPSLHRNYPELVL